MNGPYETRQQARETPAVRAVYEAFDRDHGPGKMIPHNLRMLTSACAAAGVQTGAYDEQTLMWLAGWEPETCAVIAGLVIRAARHAAPAPRPGHQCPASECGEGVAPGMLMCRTHWRMVPADLRSAVWSAWRRGAGAGTPEHRAAILAAVDAVNGKLGPG